MDTQKETSQSSQAVQRDLVKQALSDTGVARAVEAYERAAAFAPRPSALIEAKITVSTGANS